MGFFAVYSGFIYNDFVSVMPNIFSTCWTPSENPEEGGFTRQEGCVYPFGFDWRWSEAVNEIEYFNSFKMKFAVIAGVIHMTLGIFMKGANCIHFGEYTNFFFEFIPQFLFFFSIFGYMCFAIIIKWLTNWEAQGVSKPPEIIALMINFVSGVKTPLWGDATTQLYIQQTLAIIAVSCIPIMLFMKPIVTILSRKEAKPSLETCDSKARKNTTLGLETVVRNDHFVTDDEGVSNRIIDPKSDRIVEKKIKEKVEESQEEENFGELMIHQLIETIEFALGSISNTASYLR